MAPRKIIHKNGKIDSEEQEELTTSLTNNDETNSNNTLTNDDKNVNEYIENCRKYDIQIDPSIVISLKTGWDILQPALSFSEGGLLPLLDILKNNKLVKRLNFSTSRYYDSRYRTYGNGNSNARLLKYILHSNHIITDLNLSSSGLNDDGISEIAEGLKYNKSIININLSYNNFGEKGAEQLRESLLINNHVKHIDLSNNALGFRSINNLVCSCKLKRSNLNIITNGNYVFEEILNSVSHGICFIISIIGACLLVTEAADEVTYSPYHFWSCVLYSFSLTFLFLSSCLYHSFFMLPQGQYNII